MGLLDFLSIARRPAPPPAAELDFATGREALEYISRWLPTDWQAGATVTGLLGQPSWCMNTLSAPVLVPTARGFLELPTLTSIRAVAVPGGARMPLGEDAGIGRLGLRAGDLVSVYLAEQNAELARMYPQSEGWVAFISGKNRLRYSLVEGAWRQAWVAEW